MAVEVTAGTGKGARRLFRAGWRGSPSRVRPYSGVWSILATDPARSPGRSGHESPEALTSASDTAQLTVAAELERILPELVGLGLEAKQAHWNVTGPIFLPLHDLTDEMAANIGAWADGMAERAVALGLPVDARPATVASASIEAFPAGWVSDCEVVMELARRVDRLADTARIALDTLESNDAVVHDLTVDALEGLDKFRWMLLAHTRWRATDQ